MGGGDKLTSEDPDSSGKPSLTLEVKCDAMKAPASPTEVTVMARLTASAQKEGDRRAPVTLCAAIDRSSSMKEHLPLLKETLCFMIQQLKKDDKLCLVTFDHEVRVDLPLTSMDADGKAKATQAVDRVKERGQTNLSGGLLAALQTLYRIKSDDAALVESVLLFTDGKANRGIVDQAVLVKSTKSLLEQINRQACVFTFGYGTEHDSDLLHAVSEAGHGLFYYIDTPDSIPDSFCDCLGGLLSVTAQNVKLTFSASAEGSSLHKPNTTYKVEEKERGKCYQLTIHDIYCEEERCILTKVSLLANETITEPTTVPIVTCKLEFFDVVTGKQSESMKDLSLVRNNKLSRIIPSDDHDDIELHRIRCEVASSLEEANALADKGKIPAAKEKLLHAKRRVKESRVAAIPLAAFLVETVDESLEGLEDTCVYEGHGRAVMKNYAGSHWQQRSNAAPSKEGYMRSKRSQFRGGSDDGGAAVPVVLKSKTVSPYINFSKNLIMERHSSSTSSSVSSRTSNAYTTPSSSAKSSSLSSTAPTKATAASMDLSNATPAPTGTDTTPMDMN